MSFKQHIPNFLTCCNLICGCFSLFLSFEQQFLDAFIFILVAGVFDFFDGMVARLLKVSSPIGKELDSMADMVTFGVAPVVFLIMYLFSLSGDTSVLHFLQSNIWLLGFALTPALSAIRLAKFNLDTKQDDGFIGLNTPTNTFLLLSLPFIAKHYELTYFHSIIFILSISVISALLLNAKIPMINLKFKNLSFQSNKWRYILIITSVIVIIFSLIIKFIFICFPIIILLYLILSIIENRQKNDI